MAASSKRGGAVPAIGEVLGTLAERQRRLDEADTRLSQLISEAESELQQYLSIRVSVDITDHLASQGSGIETALAFGKQDGKWQLLIETAHPDRFGADITPLLSCTREMRFRVFSDGCLEELIRGAVAQLDKQLVEREAAIEKGSALIRALGGGPF